MRALIGGLVFCSAVLFAAPAPIIVDTYGISNFTGNSSTSNTTIQITNHSSVNFLDQSNAANAAISIDATSTLGFSQTSASTYSGLLSGSGSVTKNGSGDLTMTGNNASFTGPLSVLSGVLHLNGAYGGSVSVSPSATIIYGGPISGNLQVNSGTITTLGTGTLSVGGTYSQSGSAIYIVNINSAGQSSLINIASTAAIGGFLEVNTAGGVLFNHRYTVLHANGGVTGTYSLLGSYPSLGIIITYDLNNVYLSFGTSFSGVAQTNNEKNVANQLDQLSPPLSADEAAVLGVLGSLDPDETRRALNLMSGEQYANFLFSALDGDNRFSKRIYNAYRDLIDPCVVRCEGVNTWVSAGAGREVQKGSSSTFGFGQWNYDLSAGAHSCLSESCLLGGALGYEADFVHSSLAGTADLKTGQLALYSAYQSRYVYLLSEIIAARTWSDYTRPIQFGTLNRGAKSKPRLNHGKFDLELGFNVGGCHFLAQPFLAGAAQLVQQTVVRESGADSLNLSLQSPNKWIGSSFVGCHFNFNYSQFLKVAVDLAWQHDYGNLQMSEQVRFSQFGLPFFIEGPTRGHDGAVGAFYLTGPVKEAWSFYLEALGEVWSRWYTFEFNGGISYRW